jgi:hypothetical protein
MALTPAERRRRNAIQLLNMAMLLAAPSADEQSSILVLTLVEDGLEEDPPFLTFSSTAAGTLRWDFHSSITPPTAGAGDHLTGTQSIGSGITVWDTDLSAAAGETGYLHYRVTNGAGTSNILTSQVITVPSGVSTGLYMEDGSSFILMEDGSSILLMEG